MRKYIILAIGISIGISLNGQTTVQRDVKDSAQMVVENYLRLLNYDAISQDTMLYIETYIYSRDEPSDTMIMKRWYWAPFCFRTEVWHGDTLTMGLRTNSYDSYMSYDRDKKRWFKIDVVQYYILARGYDFRGQLYHWKSNNTQLTYNGVWNYNGHEVYRIFVKRPGAYHRNYLFEKESGLLFLIDETDNYQKDLNEVASGPHIDWRAIHEYQPLGNVTFPSIESYQIENDIVLMFHKYKYLPIKKELFIYD